MKMNLESQILLSSLIVLLLLISEYACIGTTISCFRCDSRNGSDVNCEDPFNATASSYIERCKIPKRERDGLFPAHYCSKVIGTSYRTKEKRTIRTCVRVNMDSQCGDFKLDDERHWGCILTCDRDGCNSSPRAFGWVSKIMVTFMPISAFLCWFWWTLGSSNSNLLP